MTIFAGLNFFGILNLFNYQISLATQKCKRNFKIHRVLEPLTLSPAFRIKVGSQLQGGGGGWDREYLEIFSQTLFIILLTISSYFISLLTRT